MAVRFSVVSDEPVGTISPRLYGHFMEHLGGCIDGGVWVGTDSAIPNTDGIRNDVVEALKGVGAPVVRWPGGCFADDYHWRDGIGPRESRPRRVNMHWGDCIERNEFGTHEFMALCRAIGAEPYLAGNLGSGTPKEMRDWVEYCNFPGGSTLSDERIANGAAEPFSIQFWGVGNENWGCGGNFSPEDYCTEYRRFSTYLRAWGGTKPFLIACGPSSNDAAWTRRFFEKLKNDFWSGGPIHGYAAHHYCGSESTAIEFEPEHWTQLLVNANKMEELIVDQRKLMDEYDPEGKTGLIVDEWGAWHRATPGTNPAYLWQQSTQRDAVVAGLTFDIFNRHADKVFMANLAQTINVLQSLLLTDGGKMVKTPTYHVFDLYRPHMGGKSLNVRYEGPDAAAGLPLVAGSASTLDGKTTVTLTNQGLEAVEVRIVAPGLGWSVAAVLPADGDVHSHNTFERPDAVNLVSLPAPAAEQDGCTIVLAPGAVARVRSA